MFLVFVILTIVTICVTIVVTYFLLNNEDYRWPWTSFAASSSTAGYVLLYSVYYFFMKTKVCHQPSPFPLQQAHARGTSAPLDPPTPLGHPIPATPLPGSPCILLAHPEVGRSKPRAPQMSGFFQTLFYFAYMLVFCLALGLICGTLGYTGCSVFVRRIYRNIKSD